MTNNNMYTRPEMTIEYSELLIILSKLSCVNIDSPNADAAIREHAEKLLQLVRNKNTQKIIDSFLSPLLRNLATFTIDDASNISLEGISNKFDNLADNIGRCLLLLENSSAFITADQLDNNSRDSLYKLFHNVGDFRLRINHYYETKDNYNALNSRIDSLRESLNEELGKRIESFSSRQHEEIEKTKRSYITILGIFAAAVLAFNAGIGFSSSTIEVAASFSYIWNIVFITSLVGIVSVDALSILLGFLWYLSNDDSRDFSKLKLFPLIIMVNAILFIVMVVSGVVSFLFF